MGSFFEDILMRPASPEFQPAPAPEDRISAILANFGLALDQEREPLVEPEPLGRGKQFGLSIADALRNAGAAFRNQGAPESFIDQIMGDRQAQADRQNQQSRQTFDDDRQRALIIGRLELEEARGDRRRSREDSRDAARIEREAESVEDGRDFQREMARNNQQFQLGLDAIRAGRANKAETAAQREGIGNSLALMSEFIVGDGGENSMAGLVAQAIAAGASEEEARQQILDQYELKALPFLGSLDDISRREVEMHFDKFFTRAWDAAAGSAGPRASGPGINPEGAIGGALRSAASAGVSGALTGQTDPVRILSDQVAPDILSSLVPVIANRPEVEGLARLLEGIRGGD